jgi:rare lipoprotein A
MFKALMLFTAVAANGQALAYQASGNASWYGPGFDGRRTASGERFNRNALTAAHKTLPLHSRVRVTNLANNKSVVVKINDRGPYVRKRIIDLSQAAARAIGLRGLGRVAIADADTGAELE